MKRIIILFFSLVIMSSFASAQFSSPVRLTTGNNDRNPTFDQFPYYIDLQAFNYELMAFERVDAASSQICVAKINSEGPEGSELYITNDSYKNINPAIAYNAPRYVFGFSIRYALIVWQSDRYGRQSILGCSYNFNTGWSSPFVVDSSGLDNRKPSIISLDTANFSIAYESGNDIKYLEYNILTNSTSTKTNLTASDPEVCSNPHVTVFNNELNNQGVAICYDKEISITRNAIYYRLGTPGSIPSTGSFGDTIAYAGVNHAIGFGRSHLSYNVIYETNRNGNIDIYTSEFHPVILHSQNPVVVNSAYDNLKYVGTDFPITDNTELTNGAYTYFRKNNDGLSIVAATGFSGSEFLIRKVSDDPLYRSKISLNIVLRVAGQPSLRYWFVYNKDSSDTNYPSTIYGIPFTDGLSAVNSNSQNLADHFSLSQNYPNPFNPSTKINYSVPASQNIQLKVYDILGNEVATLVDQKQNAGSYSVEFDGSKLSSGIYFYKLTNESLSYVKKMTLLK